MNFCYSNLCLNNGICINGLDEYYCVCFKSFIGVNCEIGMYRSFKKNNVRDYIVKVDIMKLNIGKICLCLNVY